MSCLNFRTSLRISKQLVKPKNIKADLSRNQTTGILKKLEKPQCKLEQQMGTKVKTNNKRRV